MFSGPSMAVAAILIVSLVGLYALRHSWTESGDREAEPFFVPEGELPFIPADGRSSGSSVLLFINETERSGSLPAHDGVWTVTPISGHIHEKSVLAVAPDLALKNGPEGYSTMMAHASNPMPSGSPDLPLVSKLMEGREGFATKVDVVETSYRDIPAIDIAPVETMRTAYAPDDTSEYYESLEKDAAIYETDVFWPADIADVTEAWIGTRKVTRVSFRPVQYNPVTRTLRYHESITARISHEQEIAIAVPGVQFASKGTTTAPDPFECPPLYSSPVLPPMNGNPTDFAHRRAGLEVDAIYKITTSEQGIHKLTQPELIAAGVPSGLLIGGEIRMYCRDQEIAIAVSTAGLFGAGDFIVFYAKKFVGWYSLENVYWLGLGSAGLRMADVARPTIPDATEITSHFRIVEYAPNTFHADNTAPNYEGWDHWRAAHLLTNPNPIFWASDTFTVDFVVAGSNAKLCATLHGRAEATSFPGQGHNTEVDINGNNVTAGAFQWSGTGANLGSPYSNSVDFSSSLLTSPTTTFYARQVLLPGNSGADQVYLEALHLIYPRELRAVNNGLEFTGSSGTNNYEVDGFSGAPGLWVFDVTDALTVQRLTSFSTQSTGNGFSVRFGHDSAGARRYVAVRQSAMLSVDSVVKTPVRDLGNLANQASYIVICPESFQTEAFRLITNRYLRGESVVVAEPEDIYNNFSYGVKDARALRQFLGYAFHHWSNPVPQRVLIIGDASYDPNGYVDSTDMDVVTALMGGSPFNFTALDARAAMVNGTTTSGFADNLADMAVGRIPARTPAELRDIVDKILDYENLPASSDFRTRSLLVAGNEAGAPLGFQDSANIVESIMLNNGFAQTDITKEYGAGADNSGILNALNDAEGRFLCAYFGHGTHNFWDSPSLLSTTHVGSLTNTKLPIITATSCWNGYYLHPNSASECMAEVFLKRPDHGAIGFIAGTALSQDASASEIALGFYDGLLNQQVETLGDAMMQGYLSAFAMGFETAPELQFYQIFGDPGLIVNP